MKNLYVLVTVSIVAFYSTLNAQWVRTDGPFGGVYSLAASDTNLFAGNNNGKIFHSTDYGASWAVVFTGSTNTRTDALAISDTNLFVANDAGVFRSTNNGVSWIAAGLVSVGPQALAISDTNLFGGTFQSGVYRSTNNGSSWTAINNGLLGNALKITALFVSDTNLFAGTWGSSAFRSTNNGTTWTSANNGLTSNNVHAFTVSTTMGGSKNLFAGTYFVNGIYLSSDNGGNWTAMSTGLTNINVRALACSDTNLFAGTDGGGVFFSANNGLSWTTVNEGLTNNIVNALIVYDTYLFAGTGDGVWRRPLSEMITTGVEDQNEEIPSQFVLKQNYPNPFNPQTRIQYDVSSNQLVTLKVFDVLGKDVATLVNEEKPNGIYKVTFDATQLPSGVYFYRLQAGSFVQTRKMILLK